MPSYFPMPKEILFQREILQSNSTPCRASSTDFYMVQGRKKGKTPTNQDSRTLEHPQDAPDFQYGRSVTEVLMLHL